MRKQAGLLHFHEEGATLQVSLTSKVNQTKSLDPLLMLNAPYCGPIKV